MQQVQAVMHRTVRFISIEKSQKKRFALIDPTSYTHQARIFLKLSPAALVGPLRCDAQNSSWTWIQIIIFKIHHFCIKQSSFLIQNSSIFMQITTWNLISSPLVQRLASAQSSFLMQNSSVFDTQFPVFNAQSLVLNTKIQQFYQPSAPSMIFLNSKVLNSFSARADVNTRPADIYSNHHFQYRNHQFKHRIHHFLLQNSSILPATEAWTRRGPVRPSLSSPRRSPSRWPPATPPSPPPVPSRMPPAPLPRAPPAAHSRRTQLATAAALPQNVPHQHATSRQ